MKRILLVNDDGYNAPGIMSLYNRLNPKYDVTLVGPKDQCSTTGHTLSLDRPLRLVQYAENIYSVDGYPADCTLMAIGHVMREGLPDLVISGINKGGNLGQDIFYSGTVAAAREASFHDYPSISVSTTTEFDKSFSMESFDLASDYIDHLVGHNIERFIPAKTVLNINCPAISRAQLNGVDITMPGFRRYSEGIETRKDTRGREYHWIVGSYHGHDNSINKSDCQSIHENKISTTFLPLNQLEFDSSRYLPELRNINRAFWED